MGEAKKHPPVKLVVGMISGRKPLFDAAQRELVAQFGPVDYESALMPWECTDYYSRELGENLLRKFLSFERLIEPERLVEIKLFTNQLEGKFSEGRARRINLDPGYLDSAKLVLATTKNCDHRIYIGHGIFAEVTLHFRGKSFQASEWTYPDYATPEYIAIFNEIRALYRQQVSSRGNPGRHSKGSILVFKGESRLQPGPPKGSNPGAPGGFVAFEMRDSAGLTVRV